MDRFIDANLSPRTMAILNRTRIHYKIVRISDIASSDGRRLNPQWTGFTQHKRVTAGTIGPLAHLPQRHFFAIYNATRNIVQIETDGRWTTYQITKKLRRSWKLQALGPSTKNIEHFDQPKDDYAPVEIINQNHQQLSTECSILQIKARDEPKRHDNFLEFLLEQNPATQFLVHNIELAHEDTEIITVCKEHKKE